MTATRKAKKKSIGLRASKKVCRCSTFFCTFLCHCFARLQRTWNVLVARFMEKNSYIFLRFIFVSLPLILTFLAANICHFLIATLIFFMFFSSTMNFASFLFFFWFCFVSFALALSPFSVIGVSVMVVGGNSRTHDHVITKFSRILQVTIFFSHARELR